MDSSEDEALPGDIAADAAPGGKRKRAPGKKTAKHDTQPIVTTITLESSSSEEEGFVMDAGRQVQTAAEKQHQEHMVATDPEFQ